jgi:hypothetical protein
VGALMATLMDLVRSWESVAAEFRERAQDSRTAAGSSNPECCRSMAVALEMCGRELRGVIGIPAMPPPAEVEPIPPTSRTGEAPRA